MREINEQLPGQANKQEQTIAEFWEKTDWPFVAKLDNEGKPENLKPSTQWGYRQVWNQHLKPYFGTMTLKEYGHSETRG